MAGGPVVRYLPRMNSRRARRLWPIGALVCVAAIVVGCDQPTSSPAAGSASPTTDEGFVLVAMGDSIPYNSPNDCPGCTGFVDSYASYLGAGLGEPVTVKNVSRHDGARSIDILGQVQSGSLETILGSADMVIISIGFNDQPPFVYAPEGCPPAPTSDSPAALAAAAPSQACIDAVVPVIEDQVAKVFSGIRAASPAAVVAVLTPYDTWRGWTALNALDDAALAALLDAETNWFHTWNAALCTEAEAIDAICVDVYRAFNGADGTRPAGDLVVPGDYTHPSQKGNDTIRDLLESSPLFDALPSG